MSDDPGHSRPKRAKAAPEKFEPDEDLRDWHRCAANRRRRARHEAAKDAAGLTQL